MPVPLKEIHLLEKVFCWQSRGIRNEFDRYRAYVCRTGKNKLLPHMSAMLVPLKEVHSSTTKVFLLAIFQRYMVQNVPDLGHIPILATYCSETLQCISRQNYARYQAYFQMCKEFIVAVWQKYDQFHVPNISPWTNWSRMCPISVIWNHWRHPGVSKILTQNNF